MGAKMSALGVALLVGTTGLWGGSKGACRKPVTVDIPFELQYGRVVTTTGEIGVLENKTIVIDTGLYWTVIDQELARKLGLSGSGQSTMVTASDVLSLPQVTIPELRVGSMVVRSLPAVIMDLKPFRERTRLQVDLFIGLHVLTRSSAALDFVHNRIEFRPSLLGCTTSVAGKGAASSP